MVLACSIECLHMLLGEPDFKIYRNPLSIENQFKITCSYLHTHLGVFANVRHLTLSTLDNKHQCLVKILLTTWNGSRKRFALDEVALLLWLASILALTTQWVNHTCIVT